MAISTAIATPRQLQQEIKEILLADAFFAEHRVKVITADDGDLRFEINKKVSQIEAPTVVISCTQVTPMQPDIQATIQITVSEFVPNNRSQANFATAMDIAIKTVQLVDSTKFRTDNITQELAATGELQATITFTY